MIIEQAPAEAVPGSKTVLIGLGANLPSRVGPPKATLEAALVLFADHGVTVIGRSSWYVTTPVPASDQPLFVNGVARVTTELAPLDLLAAILSIERAFGRERSVPNAARCLDLDILSYDAVTMSGPALTLPHPRMTDRLFVLAPLAELAPEWRHPLSGLRADALLRLCQSVARAERVERLS
jgi:2-amino-4-hydroxy-6-hydroxymethyldihydropteridine diphosphokinase